MSDRGLGQPVKFESLTGYPCALKASLFWVRISPINANSETTACGLPSGHSCLPPVCLLIAEERGKRLGGKGIFMAIPQNTSILPPRIMESAVLPKSGRLERRCHARWSSSNAGRNSSDCALDQMFQVFQFAPGVLAIALDHVKNAHGIPFEESSEGTSRKARRHMG